MTVEKVVVNSSEWRLPRSLKHLKSSECIAGEKIRVKKEKVNNCNEGMISVQPPSLDVEAGSDGVDVSPAEGHNALL